MATANKQQPGSPSSGSQGVSKKLGEEAHHAMEETVEGSKRSLGQFRDAVSDPKAGAAAAGAAIIGAGAVFGWGPAGVAALAGYAAYRAARAAGKRAA
jgi:hypothetical protein